MQHEPRGVARESRITRATKATKATKAAAATTINCTTCFIGVVLICYEYTLREDYSVWTKTKYSFVKNIRRFKIKVVAK